MSTSAVLHNSTKLSIQQALFVLLKEKDFAKISVAEIAKQAHINRGTFYLHYKDKDMLFQAVKSTVLHDLEYFVLHTKIEFSLDAPKRYELLQYTVKLFAYVAEHVEIFKVLLLNGSSITFSNELGNLIKRWFIYGQWPHPLMWLRKDIPEHYLATMAATSLVSCLVEWLSTEHRETPEKMANFYVEMTACNRP